MTDRPLRVCVLMNRYTPDFTGWGIQLERLLPHLAAQGLDATVLTRRPVSSLVWAGKESTRVLRILPALSEPMARLRGIWTLRRHMGRHRHDYDVVHASFPDLEFYLNIPYLKSLGLPVIHEMILLGADDPASIGRERLGTLKVRLLHRVDAWIGISEVFRRPTIEAGVPEERFRCIHPGVDIDRYRPVDTERRRALRAALSIPQQARVAISVGAVLPRKGMDRLLRAWQRTEPQPGRDLLLLIGPATESEGLRPQFLSHVAELEARAAEPDLAGTVRLVGRVDNLDEYMAAADIFALLSLKEGFGTVIAEAMASALPCLLSPLDGIASEILTHGETGFITERPEDPEEVASQLRPLLEQPELRRQIGEAAMRSARDRFSFQVRAAKLAEGYRALAARSAGS